ncbi:MAG: hypothetical protein II817_10835 [Bacteroidales bacterium]|nr:hypothetical protein [Bacteroidales bacterium]
MKRLIVIFIVAAHLASCGKHSDITDIQLHPDAELIHIDSLMQSSPDSALQTLLSCHSEYEVRGTSLNYNDSYRYLLLSEALYKTDNPQDGFVETHSRAYLQTAMRYFDSLALRYPNNDDITMLSARSHYMNGVGYYEIDSVVEACKESLKVLEIMENHFDMENLTGYKAKFMGLTYTRLGEMFFNYGVAKPALDSYKNALACFSRLSNYSFANTYRRIGCSYLLDNNNDTALYYYRKALCLAKKENKLSTYGASLSEISSIYYESGYTDSAYLTIREALTLPMNENQRLTRYHTLGTFFAKDCIYDSAIIYLEKSAKSDSYATRTVASELLMKCYQALGDTVKMHYYKNLYGEDLDEYRNVLVTEDNLVSVYDSYKQNHLQKAHYQQIKKQIINSIVFSVFIITVIVTIVILFRNKIIELKKKSLNDIKRKDKDLADMKRKIEANTFIDEPICETILKTVSHKHFKSKVKFEEYKEYALSKNQLLALRDAADRHYDNFTQKLRNNHPELSRDDVDCCCLYLLGLKDAEISALIQKDYTAINRRRHKLEDISISTKAL